MAIDWPTTGTALAGILAGIWAWWKTRQTDKKGTDSRAAQLSDLGLQVAALAAQLASLNTNLESMSSAVQSGLGLNRGAMSSLREEVGRMAHEMANLTAAITPYTQMRKPPEP